MVILSVFSLKGGVGKTSVVLGLASAAQAKGVRTLVVDMDPQADSTLGLDVQPPPHTVADILATPTKTMAESALVPSGWGEDGPDVLAGSPRTADFDAPNPPARDVRRLAEALRKLPEYPLVLIDCPPALGGLTRTALVASDRALVVTEPGLFALTAAHRALGLVQELRDGIAPQVQPLGVVVNRVKYRSAEQAFRMEELKRLFGPLVIAPSLPERSALQQAQGAARPIHQWPGNAAAEMADNFDRLLARVLRARPRR